MTYDFERIYFRTMSTIRASCVYLCTRRYATYLCTTRCEYFWGRMWECAQNVYDLWRGKKGEFLQLTIFIGSWFRFPKHSRLTHSLSHLFAALSVCYFKLLQSDMDTGAHYSGFSSRPFWNGRKEKEPYGYMAVERCNSQRVWPLGFGKVNIATTATENWEKCVLWAIGPIYVRQCVELLAIFVQMNFWPEFQVQYRVKKYDLDFRRGLKWGTSNTRSYLKSNE